MKNIEDINKAAIQKITANKKITEFSPGDTIKLVLKLLKVKESEFSILREFVLQKRNFLMVFVSVFYLSHWFLVIPWVTIKMSIFPKKILWRKTLHTGV